MREGWIGFSIPVRNPADFYKIFSNIPTYSQDSCWMWNKIKYNDFLKQMQTSQAI